MSNNYSLYELLNKNKANFITFGGDIDVNAIIKLLADNNFCPLPCKVGDKVYKLCLKDEECDLSTEIIKECKNCNPYGCTRGLINKASDLATMPYYYYACIEVTDDNIFNILRYWNILYYKYSDDALEGRDSLYVALEGKTDEERYGNYLNWFTSRNFRFSEIANLSTPDEEFEGYLATDFSILCDFINNNEEFHQNFQFVLQCENAKSGLLEALVYKHLPSGRYLCLDTKEPYDTSGRVCEVEVITSISYKSPEELGSESARELMQMAFEPYFCGGHILLDDNDKAMVWFKEREKYA